MKTLITLLMIMPMVAVAANGGGFPGGRYSGGGGMFGGDNANPTGFNNTDPAGIGFKEGNYDAGTGGLNQGGYTGRNVSDVMQNGVGGVRVPQGFMGIKNP